MTTVQLSISIFLFGTTLWLGLYLLVRAPKEWYARLGGLAHLAFAIGMTFTILDFYAPSIALALRFYRFGFAAIVANIYLFAGGFVHVGAKV